MTMPEPSIAVESVTKRYESRRRPAVLALDRLDFRVERHEFVSIVGPSGCGKSTLMLLVAGLIPPSTGVIRVDGQVVKKPITNVGTVFQQDLLLPWRTALGNVMLQYDVRGKVKDSQERALALLRQVGLEEFTDAYPSALSGGMRQRVALCRAWVHDAPLLLMDEPFGALDALTRQAMNYELLALWETARKTVVLITHSIPEAVLLSDRVFVMSPRPGQILEELTIDLPRPRQEIGSTSADFSRYVGHIEEILLGDRGLSHGVSSSGRLLS